MQWAASNVSRTGLKNRPGIRALLNDAKAFRFNCVLAEALDRISRDQEDIAAIYKRLRHADIRLMTLAEGEISVRIPAMTSTDSAA